MFLYFAVAILVIFLAFYFQLVQNEHYAFYWLAILPPVVFFLLERKAARIILGLFGSYMLYFILSNKMSWSPTTFDTQSIFNISGATLILVFMVAYYEKSRKEAWSSLEKLNLQLNKNQNELRIILDSAA